MKGFAMANEKHVELLQQGIGAWNAWREKEPETKPDLREVNLSGANLSKAMLSDANLNKANLSEANLSCTGLGGRT